MLVEIELISEAIFGNGEATTSFVDMEVLKDENKLPYFKGKTFKGKLREEAEFISKYLFGEDDTLIEELFGKEDRNDTKLRFSDCKLDEKIINNIKYGIKKYIFTQDDIEKAFTDLRTFTSINNDGVSEKGTLRQSRVIKKGIKLYCTINHKEELTIKEKGIIACSLSALRNIGTMESRGKGQVICRIIENNKDVTNKIINEFEKVVF
ncbi:MAG: RAMP superfamily CRISPR-associated protein [Clostridium sp.]